MHVCNSNFTPEGGGKETEQAESCQLSPQLLATQSSLGLQPQPCPECLHYGNSHTVS